MKHISEYFKGHEEWCSVKPALLIGKGPSFEKAANPWAANGFDVEWMKNYFTVAINETSKYLNADLNFFIDLECMGNVGELLNKTVVTPIRCHYKHAVTERNMIQITRDQYAFDLGRPTGMDVFNPRRESNEYPEHEPLVAISNSFEAAFHMLCLAGFKEIYSIGIDGGTEYHPLFQTEEKPRSLNPNLNQFETVKQYAEKYGVKYVKL